MNESRLAGMAAYRRMQRFAAGIWGLRTVFNTTRPDPAR